MNTSLRKLQIKLLSPSGELLNCLNCYAGQVSVFRASSNNDLRPYQRALAGVPGPERFAISIDDEPYRADQHSLIGFGERFLATDGTTAQHLMSHGVPQDSIESLLLSFGLERAFHTQCALLSKCEERRLRLLSAVYQPKKVMILNNPFDPIAHEWRERFAELILSFARSRKQIVLVPLLTYRPECWIDNEIVARIQVGENIQKTVGFATESHDVNKLVKEMRALLNDKESLKEALSAKEQPWPQPSQAPETFQRQAERKPAVAEEQQFPPELAARRSFSFRPGYTHGLVVVLLFFLALGFWPKNKPGDAKPGTDLALNSGGQPPAQIRPKLPQNDPVSAQLPPDTAIAPALPAEPVRAVMVLDQYPPNIRNAVMGAFKAKPAIRKRGQASQEKEQAEASRPDANQGFSANDAGEFLRLLETTATKSSKPEPDSVSAPTGPTGIDHESLTSETAPGEDERREQIRQKFLEAIQRAQSRRQEIER